MPDQRCKRIFAALSEYLDGDLPVANCRELEKHLRDCRPCVAYLESLKATIQACHKLKVSKAPPTPARIRKALLSAVLKT